MNTAGTSKLIDETDRRIIAATQGGLPLTARPYSAIADSLGLTGDEVINRLKRMLADGVIRRIGAVPNHYALGFRSNGMAVWDVPDEHIQELGRRVGALDFVSHCYHRPRHLPLWPYNLFTMVHGRNHDEVKDKVRRIHAMLGENDRGHTILFSTRILKKTGLRISA